MDEPRRAFPLTSDDTEYLNNTFPNWETIADRWVLIHDFPVRPGFNTQTVTAAIKVPAGYPATPFDMVYFCPAVLRADGKTIPCTNCPTQIDGKQFQRWSRHYQPGSWHPNEDNLATHVLAIRDWLDRAAPNEVSV